MTDKYKEIEYYVTRPERYNGGTFFFTKTCKNEMYSVSNKYRYDGRMCPKCHRTLKLLKED